MKAQKEVVHKRAHGQVWRETVGNEHGRGYDDRVNGDERNTL